MIDRLRAWLAVACLRWALRLDPQIPLVQVARMVDADVQRGLRQTWVLFLTFPEYRSASEMQSWLLYHQQNGWK